MAKDIGVRRVFVVANKVRSPRDLELVREGLPRDLPFLGAIRYDENLVTADLEGRPVDSVGGKLMEEVGAIRRELMDQLKVGTAT
jgi:CO dehydrogenase maturation factor